MNFDLFNQLFDGGCFREISKTALQVLLAYIRYSDSDGVAYPSNSTLAQAAGQAYPSHVRTARAELETAGLLKRLSTGGNGVGRTSKFQVTIPASLDGGKVPRIGAGAPNTGTLHNGDKVPRNGAGAPNRGMPRLRSKRCPDCAPKGAPNRGTEVTKKYQEKGMHAARARAGDGGKASGGRHREAVVYFCDQWQTRYGDKYPFAAKDAKLVQGILGHVDQDLGRFKRAVDAYLASDDDFYVRARHPIGLLSSQLARFIVAAPSDGSILNEADLPTEAEARAMLEACPDDFDPPLPKSSPGPKTEVAA